MNIKKLIQQGLEFYTNPMTSRKAAECFERAIEGEPNNVEAHLWLAYTLWEYEGDLIKAEQIARAGITIDKKRADLHLVLAWIIKDLRGYTKEYLSELELVVLLKPEWITPRGCLVDYYITNKDFSTAQKEIENAIVRFQKNVEVPEDKILWIFEYFITGNISDYWRNYLYEKREFLKQLAVQK